MNKKIGFTILYNVVPSGLGNPEGMTLYRVGCKSYLIYKL